MTDYSLPWRSAQEGLMTGMQMGRQMRQQRAQREAASMIGTGDRDGAARTLMSAGMFGEAGTMTNVLDQNEGRASRRAAGGLMVSGDYMGAAAELYRGGDLTGGEQLQGRARSREAGAALTEDPRSAAAIAAAGGDIEQATQLLDWADRADDNARQEATQRAGVMAPILNNVARLPYEQRRAAVTSQTQALAGIGFTPEQLAAFDPTDDNIRAVSDSVLGLEKVLGGFSQRVVGDEVRTYRTNPYGVERVGSEPVPYSRDEGREDKRLGLEEERIGLQRAQLNVANSTGDVLGPLLQRYSRGESLNEQEDSIVQHYLRSQQGAGMFGMPGAPPLAPPPQAPLTGANGAATSNRSGIAPTGAGQADPFPGIADGQIVEQDGVRYQRRGSQMVRAQ